MTENAAADNKATPAGPQHRYTATLAGSIESRWQHAWADAHLFHQPNPGDAGFDASKPKFYCLDMFPYPSGAGLHVGHPEGYTATDILCRYKRMKGFNVLHPMGWDAFGLPAEQYAIQTGVHPAETTRKSIDNFRRQLQRFGFCYDWSREFGTIDPDYYKWTQWIFVQIYESWFDPRVNKARPISSLVEDLEHNRLAIDDTGAAVPTDNRYTQVPGVTGEPAGYRVWHDLSAQERRDVIDNHRLAYLGEQTVNWCPKLGTALANEEVIDGKSERGGFPVFRKPLRQWMFRITAYAQRLLDGLEDVDWPTSTKTMQTEWIGRSEGAEIDFDLTDPIDDHTTIRVFTTRPDTVFGATYMTVAPEHPLIDAVLANPSNETPTDELRAYAEAARNRSDVERQESKEKTGVFTGLYATNPLTQERIPVWTSDYVLMGYGFGAVMAVPAGDQRDFEFARTFNLEIRPVVKPTDAEAPAADDMKEAFTAEGVAINSSREGCDLNGLSTPDAKDRIIEWLESSGVGRRRINYKLRDWLFSRQRYWGEPFPIVFDDHGNHHAVGEAGLPVTLPDMADYKPVESDDPQPLLAKAADWLNTTAAKAHIDALDPSSAVTREANTMPGWAGSCWYYLRYCDPKNNDRFVSSEAEQYWLENGVDLYIGGAEHAVLHLLYARFWHKALFDLGHVSTDEPFQKLFHQGLILSHAFQRDDKSLVPTDEVSNKGTTDDPEYIEDATNKPVKQIVAKMSKSLKNVVNPDDVIADFGADTFRLYEMYMGPLDASKPWNTRDIAGLMRFCQRAWRMLIDEESGAAHFAEKADDDLERRLHRLIAKVESDYERLAFNTAIAAMIEFVNAASAAREKSGTLLTADQARRFALVLCPSAPHLAEELWERAEGEGFASAAPWPTFDESMLTDDAVEIAIQLKGKVRHRMNVPAEAEPKAIEDLVLSDEKVKAMLEGLTIRKVIVVPGRMVNIVAT